VGLAPHASVDWRSGTSEVCGLVRVDARKEVLMGCGLVVV